MSDLFDLDWFMRERHAEIPAHIIHMEPTDQLPAPDSPEFAEALLDHFMYWLKLEQEGLLLGAGPMEGPVGMAIVLTGDRAEAERLAAEEPFAKRGYRRNSVQPWSLNEGLAVAVAKQAG